MKPIIMWRTLKIIHITILIFVRGNQGECGLPRANNMSAMRSRSVIAISTRLEAPLKTEKWFATRRCSSVSKTAQTMSKIAGGFDTTTGDVAFLRNGFPAINGAELSVGQITLVSATRSARNPSFGKTTARARATWLKATPKGIEKWRMRKPIVTVALRLAPVSTCTGQMPC